MTTCSVWGVKYLLNFIDEFSHLLLIYIVQSKDEPSGKFKEFKSLLENQSKITIKSLIVEERVLAKLPNHFSFLMVFLGSKLFPTLHNIMEKLNRTIVLLQRWLNARFTPGK
jgi:hypothetical protein